MDSFSGLYLLSGGKENVLVLWHLESENKSFQPRLGSKINHLFCSKDSRFIGVTMDNNSKLSLGIKFHLLWLWQCFLWIHLSTLSTIKGIGSSLPVQNGGILERANPKVWDTWRHFFLQNSYPVSLVGVDFGVLWSEPVRTKVSLNMLYPMNRIQVTVFHLGVLPTFFYRFQNGFIYFYPKLELDWLSLHYGTNVWIMQL